MRPDEITAHHRSRSALVYVRQSTLLQVRQHGESLRRQCEFIDRAEELGWPPERVVRIDEDLGESASRSQVRSGFTKMVAETALGNVGLILALEVSRLCRGNRDWYHLLDVCAVTRTLIADAEGLYDPRDYNDRLLLGLKGTMSEAELHVMKQRLVEAVRARARRGEHRMLLPPGYVWDEAGRIVKSPDDQERAAIEMVFARFARLGTMHQVQGALADEGVKLPVRAGRGWGIRYRSPSAGHVRRILKNPMYAGAYVYGRRQVEEVLDASQRPRKRMRERPRDEWHVLIRDHHEGYVAWEAFERIQRQIASNRRGGPGPGAPREGESLMAGLVLCGRCGRRMKVGYGRGGRLVRYVCTNRRRQTGAGLCQGFGARRLERAVEELLLEALAPLGVEAMIEAARAHANACDEQREHERQRVKRARYEVDLARRQYESVDPANRLVASELERRWEKALGELAGAQEESEARLRALSRPLGTEEEDWLRSCAGNLAMLWESETTRPQDRKRIARCLIENVVVTVPERGETLNAKVHWVGGEVTTLEVRRGRTGKHRYVTDPELVELVRTLAAEFTDAQIARILSRKGLKTAKGLAFKARHVTNLRCRYGIDGSAARTLRGENVYTALQAAERLSVTPSTIIRWIEAGLLEGSQLTSGAPWKVKVTEKDQRRLTAIDAPEGWLPLKGAAQSMEISQQAVLQKLNSGELEGVRVRVGRRTGWRIRVPSTTYDEGPSLFDHSDIPGDAL